MVTFVQLWLPILLSAVGVFAASTLVHLVFKWHNAEYLKLPNEDEVRAVVGKIGAQTGMYVFPHCIDGKDMQKPEMQKKFVDGPVGMLTMRPNGPPKLGKSLGLWFAFTLLVSGFAACVAGTTMTVGTPLTRVFHIVAMVTFLAYGGGAIHDLIWMGKTVRRMSTELLDALIYALVSAAVFAWLWPQ